ncbi:MAG: twin-arginine translocase TatA/TatE family subunit [Planctomycetota bacterium]
MKGIAAILGVFGGGPWEIAVVAMIALLLFGTRIPTMMRSLGTGIVEFRKGLKGESEEGDKKSLPEGEDKADKDE